MMIKCLFFGLLFGPALLSASGSSIAGGSDTLYVDGSIQTDHCRNYSPETRKCGGGKQVAYQALAGASAVAVAGNKVLIRGGVYREILKPKHSGTKSKPLIFRGYEGETAIISGEHLKPAIDISYRSHLILENIEVHDVRRWLYGRDADYNQIINCRFIGAHDPNGSSKTGLFFEQADHNRIINNLFDGTTQDNLSLVKSDSNLVQGNRFRNGKHTLWTIKCGNKNIIRGNDLYNELQKIGEIYDCHNVGFDHQFDDDDATKHNLVEDNDFTYTPSSGRHSPYAGIQHAAQQSIIRHNRFRHTIGPAMQLALYGKEARYNTGNRIYNNTFHATSFAAIEIALGGKGYHLDDNLLVNNAFTRSIFVVNDERWDWYNRFLRGAPVQIKTARLDGFFFDNNLIFNKEVGEFYLISHGVRNSNRNPYPQSVSAWMKSNPELFRNFVEADPQFVDEGNNDFTPGSSSPLVDSGRFLTRTRSAGSGTEIPLDDASWFQDGFGIPGEKGDEIQLEDQQQRANILSVDYKTNQITLDRPLTWNKGQGLALSYNGRGPDIGAIERP